MAADAQLSCWYAVLGVAPAASAEEVKAAYRRAALRAHPDKAGSGGPGSGSGGGASSGGGSSGNGRRECTDSSQAAYRTPDFLLVQQAWQVLQDAGRRAAYDRQLALAAVQLQVHINEAVPLQQLDFPVHVEGQECYAWPCRCGGTYLLLREDVREDEVAGAEVAGGVAELAVPCSTCSLHISVLLGPDVA